MKSKKAGGNIESPKRSELIEIRNRMGLTQADMATRLAVSKSTLEKYEQGKRTVTDERMEQIRGLANLEASGAINSEPAEICSDKVHGGQKRYDSTMNAIGVVFTAAAVILFAGAFIPGLNPTPWPVGISLIITAALTPALILEVWRRACLGYPTRRVRFR